MVGWVRITISSNLEDQTQSRAQDGQEAEYESHGSADLLISLHLQSEDDDERHEEENDVDAQSNRRGGDGDFGSLDDCLTPKALRYGLTRARGHDVEVEDGEGQIEGTAQGGRDTDHPANPGQHIEDIVIEHEDTELDETKRGRGADLHNVLYLRSSL